MPRLDSKPIFSVCDTMIGLNKDQTTDSRPRDMKEDQNSERNCLFCLRNESKELLRCKIKGSSLS